MFEFSSVHGDKLVALQGNPKLPASDAPRVQGMLDIYQKWRRDILTVTGDRSSRVAELAKLLNEYKYRLDFEFIFGSPEDFLYRQKGQLKLDNSVIEEFMPIYLKHSLNDIVEGDALHFGPSTCFSSVYFTSGLATADAGGGLSLRQKDQDFVISRKLYLSASLDKEFIEHVTFETNLAYVAVECKTNLDKTMFQEAAATALDLKTSVPSAKYFLVCEWLDMMPISSSTTAIDEVLILRKAKRLASSIRSSFSTQAGRESYRGFYADYLKRHPYSVEVLERLATHVRQLLDSRGEEDVLLNGYF